MQESERNKIAEGLGVVFAITFISIVILLVYMKYSNSCDLLGAKVENVIGSFICQADNNDESELAKVTEDSTDEISKNLAKLEEQKKDLEVKVLSEDDTSSVDIEDLFAEQEPNLTAPLDEAAELLSQKESVPVPTQKSDTSADIKGDGAENSIGGADAMQAQGQEPSVAMDPTADPTRIVMQPPPPPVYETPALLVANNKLNITSLITAKVKSLGYKDGEEFKKDDILLVFDCKDLELDLAVQQAVLKDRLASVENLNKLKELKSTSEYSIIQAESELEQTKKIIEKYEHQLKNCIIKANYSGKVIFNQVTENQFLAAGQEIMTVNNNQELLVKAYVPVEWMPWLKRGTTFNLCMNPDNCYSGVVNRVGAEVDAISQTLDIFGKLTTTDNSKLIAGLSGQITFDKL